MFKLSRTLVTDKEIKRVLSRRSRCSAYTNYAAKSALCNGFDICYLLSNIKRGLMKKAICTFLLPPNMVSCQKSLLSF